MKLPLVVVERLNSEGEGVGKLPSGKVVFVPRTVPGDRVSVRVDEEKGRWARGRAVEWTTMGSDRQEAPCPLYSLCDGCSVQHLRYSAQVAWKSRWVGDALRRIGGLDLEDPAMVPSPEELGYRNRVTLTLRRLRGGRIVAGFRELGRPGRIVDMRTECLLPESEIMKVWGDLRTHWGPGARYLPDGGELRLTLRNVQNGVSLLVGGGSGNGRPGRLLEEVPGLVSVWREEGSGRRRPLAGDEVLRVEWGDETLELQGGGFVQVNRKAAQLLQGHILEVAGDLRGAGVVDAYSGPGWVGRKLAEGGARVTGIDLDPGIDPSPGFSGSSAGSWDSGGSGSGFEPGFRLLVGRVEGELEALLPVRLVLLNPPRSGLGPEVPAILRRRPPEKVIYVSCDPATLARDLKRFAPELSVRGIRSFDLFPQTAHVETVVTLERTE